MTRSDDDAWQDIVDNYGDREDVPDTAQDEWDEADAFVAEPVDAPVTTSVRQAAWVGALGAPVALTILAIAGIGVPTWVSAALAAAFVAGFLYLLTHTTNEPRDPWDDGARL